MAEAQALKLKRRTGALQQQVPEQNVLHTFHAWLEGFVNCFISIRGCCYRQESVENALLTGAHVGASTGCFYLGGS